MGTYVYAFNTKVREVSGVKLALSEYRYKPGRGYDYRSGKDLDQQSYTKLCKRRVTYFENNPDQYPDFFVYKFQEGESVFVAEHGACYEDYVRLEKAGTLVKEGRSWKIQYLEDFKLAANLGAIKDYREQLKKQQSAYYD